MFPYPSGNGLHIGHYYQYSIADSWCRYKRYIGQTVYQPFGYDSHGLPAELYARKMNRDPKDVTYENIENFRRQMKGMDTQYQEMLITSEPSYQKWTQWLFTQLLEHGLAYKKDGEVNYCTSCETVLAREQVKDGHCERCSSKVELRLMNQWYFKITDYKDRLIANLDKIDYPKNVINAQRMWLENLHDWCVSRQRKWGCPIPVEGSEESLDTFVDSSFYLIRYCDPTNDKELCSKEKYKQVDLYIGGSEHSTMHLVYYRFINMFLYDIGIVPCEEPIKRLICQGMILNDGEKMSKSKGNVVSPDNYDPDHLRFYLMFIGHYFDGGSWSDKNMAGITRFENRFIEWMSRTGEYIIDLETFKKKIFGYSESFKFNKVVSEFMTLVNKERTKNLTPAQKTELVNLLGIYMPGFPKKMYHLHHQKKD